MGSTDARLAGMRNGLFENDAERLAYVAATVARARSLGLEHRAGTTEQEEDLLARLAVAIREWSAWRRDRNVETAVSSLEQALASDDSDRHARVRAVVAILDSDLEARAREARAELTRFFEQGCLLRNADAELAMAELDARLERTPDDRDEFDDDIVSIPDIDESRYETFLDRRAKTAYGEIFAELRSLALPTLINAYAAAPPHERERFRSLVAQHPFVCIGLWSIMREQTWGLEKAPLSEKPARLRRVLLLAILAEEYLDRTETSEVLSQAWAAAESAGLQPVRYFVEAADMAGARKLSHGESAGEILRTFEPMT